MQEYYVLIIGEVVLPGDDTVPFQEFLLCLGVDEIEFQHVSNDYFGFFYGDVRVKVSDV